MNKKFLTDAIAEAKIIKESAIANAKLALEESFTPQLQSMLSQKIQEMEDEDLKENEITEVELDEEEIDLNEMEDDTEETVTETEEKEETVTETEDEVEAEDELNIENMTDEDLKAYIETVVTDMVASGEIEAGEALEDESAEDMDAGLEDEEVDLELIDDEDGLESETEIDEAKETETTDEVCEIKKELYEAYNAVKILKKELNEVNLLNAKLLYVNKIFKAKNLSESEKVKVVGSFDKAKTISEAKLVFETIKEGLSKPSKMLPNIKKHIGLASKSTGLIKEGTSSPVIEVDEQYTRWQKLAGL